MNTEENLLLRIRSEFYEMPGLALTVRQASRLWNLDPESSENVLRILVDRGVLERTGDGRFIAAFLSTRPTPVPVLVG